MPSTLVPKVSSLIPPVTYAVFPGFNQNSLIHDGQHPAHILLSNSMMIHSIMTNCVVPRTLFSKRAHQ
jgi:hypothetical protein